MKKIGSFVLLLVLIISLVLPPSNVEASSKQLEVHFINVGQGDAILVKAPGGKTMLVDGGPSSSGKELVAYLKAKGVTKLDYVVATHPDADHIGGLINVLNSFKISNFIDSGKAHTSETYYKMLNLIDKKNIKFHIAQNLKTYQLDPKMTMRVLHVNPKAADNNDASIVLKLTYNQNSFLLMGDASTKIEEQISSKYNVQSTVLKAGHHGSDTSSSAKFISRVKPKIAILSYGKNNSYGHPHAAVKKRLSNVGAKTYETAKHCNIIVKSTGKKYTVSTDCKKYANATVSKPTTSKPVTTKPTQTNFKNCTELRKVYPSGVSSKHAAYQTKFDRDKDGWACE